MHLALALLTLVPVSEAINLAKRGSPAVVQAAIQRKPITNYVQHDRLRRRSSTLTATLSNEVTLYYANITLGTPEQVFQVHLDTGSSDLWVNTASSAVCREYSQACDLGGTYSSTSSSSYAYVNDYFNISYADGSGADGIYATDTLVIGESTIENMQFGIGENSSLAYGILGIGYSTNEAQHYYSGTTYDNLPARLYKDGIIQSNSYSLWLNDLDANSGTILFGGVDTGKYTGTLETVPVIKTDGVYLQFLIALTAVGLNGVSGSLASSQDIGVLLDSGTSLTYLPDDIANAILNAYGATYDDSLGAATINCDVAKKSGSVDFTFTSPTISVDLSELVILMSQEHGEDVCIFGIAPVGTGQPVLGDTFLRSAYVVYDLSNNEISLAQTDFNSTAVNVLEITSGTDGVPNASSVSGAATTVSNIVATGRVNDVITVSSSAAAQKAVITPPPSMAMGALAVAGFGAVLLL